LRPSKPYYTLSNGGGHAQGHFCPQIPEYE
jgi:hypothetical protein